MSAAAPKAAAPVRIPAAMAYPPMRRIPAVRQDGAEEGRHLGNEGEGRRVDDTCGTDGYPCADSD